MNLLNIHHQPFFFHIPRTVPTHQPKFPLKFSSSSSPLFHSLSVSKASFRLSNISNVEASIINYKEEKEAMDFTDSLSEFDDLAPDGDVYLKTLRLVECSMFAAVTGLVYFLSNSLSIEVGLSSWSQLWTGVLFATVLFHLIMDFLNVVHVHSMFLGLVVDKNCLNLIHSCLCCYCWPSLFCSN